MKVAHLAILLAVDPWNLSKGDLEVVRGSHKMDVPIGSDKRLEIDWNPKQQQTHVELKAGQV